MTDLAELQLETCRVHLVAGVVVREDGEVKLTTREAELLSYLAARSGIAVDRDTLLQDVWGYASDVVTRAVDATVNRLRAKIEAEPANPRHLVTVWGQGYRLDLPDTHAPTSAHQLPQPLDRFVGRAQELHRISQVFADGGRLVTISGPGGMGKTRLATQFARRTEADLPDGAWFVDASEVRTEAGLVFALAGALGGRADDMQLALRSLGSALLVLDNLEQVVAVAAPQVVRWLMAAPQLRILATSRERLRVPGERVIDLGPLNPSDAADLLRDRAASSAPGIDLLPADVTDIVLRLEGIPLALELAAGLLDVLGAEGLRARLGHPIDVLSDGGRSRPERHQSLERVISSSWDLLDPPEREALAALSVFRGGFTADAAEAVLGSKAVSLLHRLRTKSLLRILPGLGHRLGAYEVIRDFASRQLQDDVAAERHRVWFTQQAIEAYDPAGAMPTLEELRWLQSEVDNLWVALDREAPSEGRVRIALALAYSHVLAGPLSLAEHALDVVSEMSEVPAVLRGHTYRLCARVAICRGRADEAYAHAAAALECGNDSQSRGLIGRSQLMLGLASAWQGRLDDALLHYDQAIDELQAIGDGGEASAWTNRGNVLARLGDDLGARRAWERALGLHQDHGNARSAAVVLGNLGLLAVDQGDAREGVRCLRRAMELHVLGGDAHAEAVTRAELGLAQLQLWQLADADATLRQATQALRRHGDRTQMAQALWGLGAVKLCEGDAERALELWRESASIETHATRRARLATVRAIAHATVCEVHPSRGHLASLKVPEANGEAERRVRWLIGIAAGHLFIAQGRADLARWIARGAAQVQEGRGPISRTHETGPFLRLLQQRLLAEDDRQGDDA